MGDVMDDKTAEEHIEVLTHHLLAAANTLKILQSSIIDTDYDDEWDDKCAYLISFLRDQATYFSPPIENANKVISLDAYQKSDFDNTRFWGRKRRDG